MGSKVLKVNVFFCIFVSFFFSCQVMAIEEPKFKILVDAGELEIRSYDEYLVAETGVEGSFDTASRKGFRRVAGYIFGENKNSIGQSEKIQMTAPVTVKPDNEGWVLHFVMPSNYDMSQLPVPNNSGVSLKKIEAHLAAVIIFSGFTTDSKIQKKTEELKAWLEKQNFEIAGPQQIARYNDPFTLPWLRRNEIIFKVTAKN
ncbi:MAG: heme-binding protein [Burkholderiaceae bacterium]|nr:MAG: heme-binding protein [Burkholderiaceae bacterium]